MSDYREAIDVVLQEVGRAVVGKEEITEKDYDGDSGWGAYFSGGYSGDGKDHHGPCFF